MTWVVCGLALLGVVFRPWGRGEWIWAGAGAAALVALRLISVRDAAHAIAGGLDVYLFLVGMMLLAELAREQGVFEWLAACAGAAARGSTARLFFLCYVVGTLVTIVLSNDATAIVLTPAVASAVRRANVPPLPFVYACAFVANAASFVLPISNPANLIVFASGLPSLRDWLGALLLPACVAIVVTYATLAYLCRVDLRTPLRARAERRTLGVGGRVALGGVVGSALALCIVAALRGPIGGVTFAAALAVAGALACVDRRSIRRAMSGVTWSILPLVAALFVLVRGLDAAGTLAALDAALASLERAGSPPAIAWLGLVCGLLTNLGNNLPVGVVAAHAISHGAGAAVRYALVTGVDLGPNLSVTGSLATILWLAAVRRAGIEMSAVHFLRMGAWVMPPALVAALACLAGTTR